MKLPIRPESHVTEAAAFKCFISKIPDRWIVRELTERDYGIDCYLEIVNSNNLVTGMLLSIQLKGISNVVLRGVNNSEITLYGIAHSTSNYWFRLPVPVILACVDTVAKKLYAINVKDYIRKDYDEFLQKKAPIYRVDVENEITARNAEERFTQIYLREQHRQQFEMMVIDFLSNYERKHELIENHWQRDFFLGVEEDAELQLRHLYNVTKSLCEWFNLPWDIPAISEMSQAGKSMFGNHAHLFEMQVSEFVQTLLPKMEVIASNVKELITETEGTYWLQKDQWLYNFVYNTSFNYTNMFENI